MVDTAVDGKVGFIEDIVRKVGQNVEERHVCFGNSYIYINVDKYPRKPKTCLGEGEKESRELEIWLEENSKILRENSEAVS